MKDLRVSAKEIAELLYGSGNITSDRITLARAQEGTQIHQYWQNKYSECDQKEVFVKTDFFEEEMHLEITGRIDGILLRDNKLILEEIKSTYVDFEYLDETSFPSHLVQAKLYAYLYSLEKKLKKIEIWLTYIQVEDKEIYRIEKTITFKVLETFFNKIIHKYLEWIKRLNRHEEERQKSIVGLNFPFPEYRLNQRELMANIYRSILEKEILYAIAPTGIGKTIATIYSALKTIHMPRQKIFYLSAKNDGKQIALDTIALLEEKGLIAKTCEITAKDPMCFLKERDCDPAVCKYANGYYKKLYKALSDLLENESIYSKDIIKKYAKKHSVCPFELSLDISNYSDIIICDYNYVFDPRVHLIRYFEDTVYQPILLVDEAHNLVSRSRDMYSATLSNDTFIKLKGLVRFLKPSPKREISNILDLFMEMELELLEVDFIKKDNLNEFFIQTLRKLLVKFDQALSSDKKIINRSLIVEIYFEIYQFVKVSEFYNQEFVFLLERSEQIIQVSIKCLNASEFIKSTITNFAQACTFFSATLDPIYYYKALLTGGIGKDVKMISSFKQDNLLLLAVDSVSTRYHDRQDSIQIIKDVTDALIHSKKGNYILFFPSYQYLNLLLDNLNLNPDQFDVIIQRKEMTLKQRSDYLMMFKTSSEKTQIGLFVMGGIFGESIDLIGDMLSGVLIVGVGLPALSPYNNILRSHFDQEFQSGFDFAYTYPGLNKVIQAVGRVIRSETDRGIAILLDDRFTSRKYMQLYPKEWSHITTLNQPKKIKKALDYFWKEEENHETFKK